MSKNFPVWENRYRGGLSGVFSLLEGFVMLKKICGVVVAVAPMGAFAAVPADVTTALTEAKADAVTVATAVLVIVFAIAGFKYMTRAK